MPRDREAERAGKVQFGEMPVLLLAMGREIETVDKSLFRRGDQKAAFGPVPIETGEHRGRNPVDLEGPERRSERS